MRIALLLAAALIAGCALKSPPTHTGVVEQALPSTTRVPGAWRADARGGEVANDWLKSFNDPPLELIVAEAIAHNPDLRVAATQVAIAQQTVVIVGSRLLPWAGVQLGATGLRDQDSGSSSSTTAFVGVAWELDVWGRLRAQRAASEANAEAVALDYAYARQSLAATTAKLWYLAIETRQSLALGERAVAIYRELGSGPAPWPTRPDAGARARSVSAAGAPADRSAQRPAD
jgi:outer membrane protein TolC